MKNNKGFSFIEVFVASSIIFMMITTFIPLLSIVEKERSNLEGRRIITSYLHDELQGFLWMNKPLPQSYEKTIDQKEALFNFSLEGDLVKGCVTWLNGKDAKEDTCFYGIRKT